MRCPKLREEKAQKSGFILLKTVPAEPIAPGDETLEKTAEISKCGKYRYELTRIWGDGKLVGFIGLNPSIADASIDDWTITRCIDYAKSWNYDGFVMVNLFALRSTDPKALLECEDPVGPENDKWVLGMAEKVDIIVAAWGNHGELYGRGKDVMKLLEKYEMHCLVKTAKGQPHHPRGLGRDVLPVVW